MFKIKAQSPDGRSGWLCRHGRSDELWPCMEDHRLHGRIPPASFVTAEAAERALNDHWSHWDGSPDWEFTVTPT